MTLTWCSTRAMDHAAACDADRGRRVDELTRSNSLSPEPGQRLHVVPAALPVPHHRPAARGAQHRRRPRLGGAQGARVPLRPAGASTAPTSRPTCCSARCGTSSWPRSRSSPRCSTARPTTTPRSADLETWLDQCRSLLGQLLHPRGPAAAGAGRARGPRRAPARVRAHHPRLHRPRRRGTHRRAAHRRLQDRPVAERVLRGQGAVPDEVLRPGRLAHPRRDPADAPAGLPRQRRDAALRARRARPARHRAQGRGAVEGHPARQRDRRVAAQQVPALRLVRPQGPLPCLGRHAATAAA